MGEKRPSMDDVARRVGVSHQTVSRVLNNHASVRPQTREAVLQAIAELGYRRNLSARALATSRTGMLGIVSSGSSRSGPAGTLGALERAARTAGYFVTVATASDGQPPGSIGDAFIEQGVEGVVVIAPTLEVAEFARSLSVHVPVLVVSAWQPDPGLRTICVDQRAGTALAVEHLLGLGHTDVVHVAGPADWFDAARRQETWHAALDAAGVRPRPDLLGDWSSERGYLIGRELAADPPTAVFATNDLTALGLLRAFAEAGLRVPQDVSVIGFDDLDGSANFFPPLTTIRQDYRALGAAALTAMLELIAGSEVPVEPLVPELIERSSTGPPRA